MEEHERSEINTAVSPKGFQNYWKRAHGCTASSFSTLYFNHYTSTTHLGCLSAWHAAKLSEITKTGSSPELWSQGLNVMIEQIAGPTLLSKRRVILLIATDFNFYNKLIFGKRRMDLAR